MFVGALYSFIRTEFIYGGALLCLRRGFVSGARFAAELLCGGALLASRSELGRAVSRSHVTMSY